jgi:lipopolysaccharide transport system ATP-binding protein
MIAPRPAIRVEGIGKRYRIGAREAAYSTLRESLTRAARSAFRPRQARSGGQEEFWSLRDVSFNVKAGEVVGVIGRNGAGKSTLLKILTRITEPTTGEVEIFGRVASLLEVGTGFHPELTGRENIYLNGAVLGMRRAEITRRFDEIVAFAEVEQFLDTPVKRYSSGMYLRLAFAVAAHLDPEVLLVDEVLAVGDAAFQERCLGKMREVASSGRTVILVSHNMTAISRLCDRCICLKDGMIAVDGLPDEAISAHLGAGAEGPPFEVDLGGDSRATSDEIRIHGVRVLDQRGAPSGVIPWSESFSVEITYEWLKPVPDGLVSFDLRNAQHEAIFAARDSDDPSAGRRPCEPGRYVARCEIPRHLLNHGEYYLSVHAGIPNVRWCVQYNAAAGFRIDAAESSDGGKRAGVAILPLLPWEVTALGSRG